jgi:mannosyltransferase
MPPRHRTVLAGIVVLAAALRFATLDVQSYWFDEATTVHLLRMGLGDMLAAIPDSESTPPLYYVVAWLWTQLFGTGEVGLRSLSALAGTATIPVVYAIGRAAISSRAGLVAAGLAAANPLLIWYSQEARAYALLVLLASLTLVVLPRALERPSGRNLAAWATLSALAVATHYFAAFLVVPEALWLFYRWRARAVVPIASVGVVALALLPMAIEQAENDGARFIRGSSEISRLGSVPKQFLVGYDAPGELIATVLGALTALYALYLLARRATPAERRGAGPLAVLAGLVVGVPALLTITGADYLITRNVIVALPPALVVLAAGYGSVRAGRTGVAAAGLLAAIGLAMYTGVELDTRYQRDDWRGIAERLGRPTGTRLLVVSPVNGRIPLEIYLPGSRKARPEEHAPITEFDVVGFTPRGPGDPSNPPRPPSPPPLPGFGPPQRIEADTYTLVRYRSPTPLNFPDASLYGGALGGAQAELVVEQPRR